jgi:dihydrofolate reductase
MDVNDYPIVIVAAHGESRTIGKSGNIPWHYPSDLKRFQKITQNNPLILGRKTHENIIEINGGALENRFHIVLTKSGIKAEESITAASTLDEAFEKADKFCQENSNATEICVVGGESVYEQTIDSVDKLQLTEIHEEYNGDSHFPEYSSENWIETARLEMGEFDFTTYISRE